MSLGKLIKELRTINIYKKTKSKYLEDALAEINVDHIPIDKMKEIIVANPDDPFLLDGYELNKEQIEKLNCYIEDKIFPDFKTKEYFFECYGNMTRMRNKIYLAKYH